METGQPARARERSESTQRARKRWIIADPAPSVFLAEQNNIPPTIASLLYARGVRTKEEIAAFLDPKYDEHIHDPFLFRDMAKAVDRLFAARDRGERVLIHGDYDADGIDGAAILAETLEAIGCDAVVFIPHRENDGFGFNPPGLAYAQEHGCVVIVTCDCGSANAETVALANDAGVDVIITDHHLIPTGEDGEPQIPPALAMIHPKAPGETYPFFELTGGGVAFKLCQAIARRDAESAVPRLAQGFEKWLLDCVAISTVADFGPLIGENRVLVHYGLIVLAKTRRLGLQALYRTARIDPERITPGTIGFQIAPRINAAGRIDHASVALRLLLTRDQEEATALAEQLDSTNTERQRLVEEAMVEAIQQVGDVGERYSLVVVGDGWAPGIVGLVASRLKDRFQRPTIALTKFDGQVLGSGRSIVGLHIVEALEASAEYLARFGGHPQACGLTVKDEQAVEGFCTQFEAFARSVLVPDDLLATVAIAAELGGTDINWALVGNLERLEPFGIGHPTPLFVVRGVTVTDVRMMGKEQQHCRIAARHGSTSLSFVCFRYRMICPDVRVGACMDVAFELGVNEWNGRRELQLKVVDALAVDV
ncbi:MAG: single-stranded-DNA-specific exonuclease RecJ [Candidatus Uhrbacteria bacterium]